MRRFFNYVRETRGELKHVSWPTRRQSIVYTVVVIIVSLAVAAYLGLFDWIFGQIIELFIL